MDKKTKMKEKKDDDAGMGADRCRVERFYQSYGR